MITKRYKSKSDLMAKGIKNKVKNSSDNLKISGNIYYVSEEENTNTIRIDDVNSLDLKTGDAVLFKRGDVFRPQTALKLKSGVSYGAYGKGNKPTIYGSKCDYSKACWQQKSDNVWQTALPYPEAGIISFNDDFAFGEMRDSLDGLKAEFDYFHDKENSLIYLYSPNGDPSDVYSRIEIGTLGSCFCGGENITDIVIDNFCLKYFSGHTVSFGNLADGITITNCQIGAGGGMHWGDERLGNAVQFWGGAKNILVENCWIYDQYDTALTFQSHHSVEYENIKFINNLLEYCFYTIEFYIIKADEKSLFKDIEIKGNIARFAGYGWGFNRHYVHGCANIVAWRTVVENTINFKITNNILDCSARSLVCWFWQENQEQKGLEIKNNSFYQAPVFRCIPDKIISGTADNPAMTYGVRGKDFAVVSAKTQAEFEAAVRDFDKNPKEVILLNENDITEIHDWK